MAAGWVGFGVWKEPGKDAVSCPELAEGLADVKANGTLPWR